MGQNRANSSVPILLKCDEHISALMQIVLNDVAFLSNNGFAQMLTVSFTGREILCNRQKSLFSTVMCAKLYF